MSEDHGRETLRRRLRQEIRKYRDLAGLTQRDVAVAMDWSPSKVNRIEAGTVAVSINDLRALLAYFDIHDPGVVSELIDMAKGLKRPSFASGSTSDQATEGPYLAQERVASVIRQYELALVPGLLQTEDYLRAVFADARLEEGSRLEDQVRGHLERQRVLDQSVPPKMFFIIDEAVLHRQVGGSGTMSRQREHLLELGSRRNISIQIVPFARGAYPGLFGPFVLLDLDHRRSRLYLEGRGKTSVRDDLEEASRYLDHFQLMEHKLASDPDHLGAALAGLMA